MLNPAETKASGADGHHLMSFPIETQHKRIPWRWVVILAIIKQAHVLVLFTAGSMTFTMRKFIEDPKIIGGVQSLDVLFNILVAAPCLYFSDRIWTRWGRRLPFVLTAWAVLAICLFALPLVKSPYSLSIFIVLYLIFWDVNQTFDTLVMEIVPPDQRGRYSAISAWMFNGLIMLNAVVIMGRFDDVAHSVGFTLRGEELIYWFGALSTFFIFLFALLFIRERKPQDPPSPALQKKMSLAAAFTNLFAERTLWPVYLLVFSTILMQTGLGAVDPLLTTEQWGYSKQDLGTNVFVGGMMNMFLIIPLVGIISDRMNRLTMFGIGVIGTLLGQIAYYVFVQFILPDQRPTIQHMIIFGQTMSAIGQFSSIALIPLIYEYIPRDKMGTAQAGLNFVRSITRLLTINGIMWWVDTYSKLCMPKGQYDYFSGYLFMILMNLVGCCFLAYFAIQVRRGKILPLGRIGFHPVEDTEDKAGETAKEGAKS